MALSSADVLHRFNPLVAEWFRGQVGKPTEVQIRSWPAIINGDHLLIAAPTGSGKTMTAFLWALNQLIEGNWTAGQTSVLYVSPLKALNNDIHRNLLAPLAQLREKFGRASLEFPHIRVVTRSGDTPSSERRRMLRHPPEILITTPESLNLMLSSAGGRSILTHLETVILDEIHAVINTKRGTHLITAVDRLVDLSGEFQRLALSATIRPMKTVARFVGGYRLTGNEERPAFEPRMVKTVKSGQQKLYDLRLKAPKPPGERAPRETLWDTLVPDIKRLIGRHTSTLVFVNSRRLCEKLVHLINMDEPEPLTYAHHGSLSREVRLAVEQQLKEGRLKAIVATNSLELGIDIGNLDAVILVQSPPAISAAVQRVGRAGHGVGELSRGHFMPTHPWDIVACAVLADSVARQDIEAAAPVTSPLDVLAQIIVSMAGLQTWDINALFNLIRSSYPFRNLARSHFDLVLEMLAGRFDDTRIRELKPRIAIDALENSVAARHGALQALYFSGGTIPDRGYFHLRHADTGDKIGELDEEYVWEAKLGQQFSLGAQAWRIEKITASDVFVRGGNPKGSLPPFWIGESRNRDLYLSQKIGDFLEKVDIQLEGGISRVTLNNTFDAGPDASDQLAEFLTKQRQVTGCSLPHRHHLVLEIISAMPGAPPGHQAVIHTLWGGRVNRPFALALEAAWTTQFGHRIEIYAGNDAIVLMLPHEVDLTELMALVTPENLELHLRNSLEASGFFGARFRECAQRALLLTRRKLNERMPLWLSRLRSAKLLDAVGRFRNFPILLEAWRTCLKDEFDLPGLKSILTEIGNAEIACTTVRTSRPSPMALGTGWRQINEYMYRDDTPRTAQKTALSDELLRELVFQPHLRPRIPREIINAFQEKTQRVRKGYSPFNALELVEWVKERLIIPGKEWRMLNRSMTYDHGGDAELWVTEAEVKLARADFGNQPEPVVVALELADKLRRTLWRDAGKTVVFKTVVAPGAPGQAETRIPQSKDAETIVSGTRLLSQWLQFYGPLEIGEIQSKTGVPENRLAALLDELTRDGVLVRGSLIEGQEVETYCDVKNFEILLRMKRLADQPAIEPREIASLPGFLARCHGLSHPRSHVEGVFEALEKLMCHPAPAAMWETEFLPARLSSYDPSWLDSLMQEGDIMWLGTRREWVTLCFTGELDLIHDPASDSITGESQAADPLPNDAETLKEPPVSIDELFPDETTRQTFANLQHLLSGTPGEVSHQIWQHVWQGRLTNDTFIALRRGIENRFRMPGTGGGPSVPTRRPHSRRGRFRHRRAALASAGFWRRIPGSDKETDPISSEERKKERVRILLDRYGLVCRELLAREMPQFRWARIFRTLRMMELSGEVITGYFFKGLASLQFMSPHAFRMFKDNGGGAGVYWINATDPLSLCGVDIPELKQRLPKRRATTHLVYKGTNLVAISRGSGKRLWFGNPLGTQDFTKYLVVLHHLLNRRFQPLRRIVIETVNDVPAAKSPYLELLQIEFDATIDLDRVILYRKIR